MCTSQSHNSLNDKNTGSTAGKTLAQEHSKATSTRFHNSHDVTFTRYFIGVLIHPLNKPHDYSSAKAISSLANGLSKSSKRVSKTQGFTTFWLPVVFPYAVEL